MFLKLFCQKTAFINRSELVIFMKYSYFLHKLIPSDMSGFHVVSYNSCVFIKIERENGMKLTNIKRGVTSFVKWLCMHFPSSNKQWKIGTQYILKDSYLCLNGCYTFLTSTIHHLIEPEDPSACGDYIFLLIQKGNHFTIIKAFISPASNTFKLSFIFLSSS